MTFHHKGGGYLGKTTHPESTDEASPTPHRDMPSGRASRSGDSQAEADEKSVLVGLTAMFERRMCSQRLTHEAAPAGCILRWIGGSPACRFGVIVPRSPFTLETCRVLLTGVVANADVVSGVTDGAPGCSFGAQA